MSDTTGAGKHHPGPSVVGLDVVDQVVAGDALDILGETKDGPARRVPWYAVA